MTLKITTISEKIAYQNDTLAVFDQLTKNKKDILLLESAEIDKKNALKSILLTHCAIKITCYGNEVNFKSTSENGKQLLSFIFDSLNNIAKTKYNKNRTEVNVIFNNIPQDLDEESRLLHSNPFESLRIFNNLITELDHPFAVFLGGVFSFDMISVTESFSEILEGENTCPDFVYYLAENIVVIDHEEKTTEIISNVFNPKLKNIFINRNNDIKNILSQPLKLTHLNKTKHKENDIQETVDISDEDFCNIVIDLKNHIVAGDVFQVVPSRTFSIPCDDSLSAYKSLKKSNPSPYMFYLKDENFIIFGASPESALKYEYKTRNVEVYPIAGTRPRGFDINGNISLDLDNRIELDLRQDKKEMAEHTMLVDLARNDIAKVSVAGTRQVPDLLKVDKYSHVMHLVSRVCGTLSNQFDALHAYQACMNMGTLSGAPKIEATKLIRKVEKKRRGSYGGAVGYITGFGEMDNCIVIRSAFVKNDIAHIQAGAGVVFDSVPESETNETRQKAQAVINAIKTAYSLELKLIKI